jgi:hypothetical protein
LVIARLTWVLAVVGLITMWAAISSLPRPRATRVTTSRSRLVRLSRPAAIPRRQRPAPGLNPHGGRSGLPADFLIAGDGRVLAGKYGEHADDQWSVDELLALAARRWER